MAIRYRDIGFVADTSSFDYDECIDQALGSLHDEGRYRVFTDLARRAGQFPRAWDHSGVTPREITVWCSNDYLGMGQNTGVLSAMKDAIDSMGAVLVALAIFPARIMSLLSLKKNWLTCTTRKQL